MPIVAKRFRFGEDRAYDGTLFHGRLPRNLFFKFMVDYFHIKRIVELGVFRGYTAKTIIDGCSIDRYTMIDPGLEPEGKALIAPPKVLHLNTTSEEAGKLYAGLPNDRNFGLVISDNVHDITHVDIDISKWWDFIELGGFMAGHDYCAYSEGVGHAVRKYFDRRFFLVDDISPDILNDSCWVQSSVWFTRKYGKLEDAKEHLQLDYMDFLQALGGYSEEYTKDFGE